VKVGKLSSTATHLPYEYYDGPFCRPEKVISPRANLGEVLTGDILHTSGYELKMMVNETCKELCTVPKFEKHQGFDLFKKLVSDGKYRMNMRMDNMPAVALVEVPFSAGTDLSTADLYAKKYVGLLGALIGYERDGKYFVNNHINFWILYHPMPADEDGEINDVKYGRVIAMYVATKSTTSACSESGESGSPEQEAKGDVKFTYSIRWVPSETKWASRWDPLLQMSQQDVATNSFAVVNSLLVTLCVSGVVAMILVRSLKRDLLRYQEIDEMLGDEDDDGAPYEDFGWKVVAHDVFRKPPMSSTLCWMVATGTQLFWVLTILFTISLVGIYSPSNRGALLSSAIIFFAALGVVSGYQSGKLNNMLGGEKRREVALSTALWFPGIMFGLFFILDLIIFSQRSSGAVPFGTLVALCGLWFGISTPLVFVGTYLAYKSQPEPWPVKVNQIPRLIPDLPWYRRTIFMTMVAGSVPFAVSFTQLFFVLSRLWLNQFVYMFGFIALVFLITAIASAEVAIIVVYFGLQAEDYNWWWKAFLAPATSGVYMYVLVSMYFLTSLPASTAITNIMIVIWLFMLALISSLVTGAVGFQACLWFVRKIYAAVKAD